MPRNFKRMGAWLQGIWVIGQAPIAQKAETSMGRKGQASWVGVWRLTKRRRIQLEREPRIKESRRKTWSIC